MKNRSLKVLTLFQLLFLLLPGTGNASPPCSLPGTDVPCPALIAELPWQFQIVQEEREEGARLSYHTQQGTQQPGVGLKITLDVSSYSDLQAADEAFAHTSQTADPDMGLSYAWDLVVIRGKRIYRLHADCTLAEKHFTVLARTLESIVPPSEKEADAPSLFCRCGGGCRPHEQ